MNGYLRFSAFVLAVLIFLVVCQGASPQSSEPLSPNDQEVAAHLVRVLLEHGADPFAKTDDGKTALDFARGDARKDQAKLLEAAMAGKKQ